MQWLTFGRIYKQRHNTGHYVGRNPKTFRIKLSTHIRWSYWGEENVNKIYPYREDDEESYFKTVAEVEKLINYSIEKEWICESVDEAKGEENKTYDSVTSPGSGCVEYTDYTKNSHTLITYSHRAVFMRVWLQWI